MVKSCVSDVATSYLNVFVDFIPGISECPAWCLAPKNVIYPSVSPLSDTVQTPAGSTSNATVISITCLSREYPSGVVNVPKSTSSLDTTVFPTISSCNTISLTLDTL